MSIKKAYDLGRTSNKQKRFWDRVKPQTERKIVSCH